MSFQPPNIDQIYKNARLPSSNWQKVDLQLTPTAITKAQKGLYGKLTLKDDYFETIFRDFTDRGTTTDPDPVRYQARVDLRSTECSWWDPIEKKVREQLDFIYPDLELHSVKILCSMENSPKQTWHSDFHEFDFVRFAGIISLFDDTKLMIKNPGNQADTEFRILKGEMVVFRGDLFHSGAAYQKENRRIYFKAIPRGCKFHRREKNSIAVGNVCEEADGGCGEKFQTKMQLYDHR